MPTKIEPQLLSALRDGSVRRHLGGDLAAGLIVGIVALPLAIAFAIASGVTPERGLYTAVIAGFFISALGGSRVQIGGPTGAFVVIVSGIVAQYGIDGLIVATIMAGIFLLAMGAARLGTAIKFIPYPVVTGFTSGIAVLIFTTQVPEILGLNLSEVPREFFGRWETYLTNLEAANPAAVLITTATVIILLLWPKVTTKVPAPFVALILTTVLAHLLELNVATIGTKFGVITMGLPTLQLPKVNEAMIVTLFAPALTIALLAAIESLLSAVVADGMTGDRHRSNTELLAQGVANIVTPLFGGIPATGAIARTATNIKSGGRTPVAGITHAISLLAISLFAARWTTYIPLATLAGILIMVSYHMSEWRTFRSELAAPKSDVIVLLTTFTLTVVVDLTMAITVGMVMAAFLFMKRMAEVSSVEAVSLDASEESDVEASSRVSRERVPSDVEVYEINGPFFFGAAEKFRDAVSHVSRKPRALILDMEKVPAMDSTGLRALTMMITRCRNAGVSVILADLQPQPRAVIQRSELGRYYQEGDLSLTFDQAIAAGGAVERREHSRGEAAAKP